MVPGCPVRARGNRERCWVTRRRRPAAPGRSRPRPAAKMAGLVCPFVQTTIRRTVASVLTVLGTATLISCTSGSEPSGGVPAGDSGGLDPDVAPFADELLEFDAEMQRDLGIRSASADEVRSILAGSANPLGHASSVTPLIAQLHPGRGPATRRRAGCAVRRARCGLLQVTPGPVPRAAAFSSCLIACEVVDAVKLSTRRQRQCKENRCLERGLH
jgi:hypothetical protein